jgi:ArsR family transcriptional regulator
MNINKIKALLKQIKAVDNFARFQVVVALNAGPLTVGEIIKKVKLKGKPIEPTLLSHHLKILKDRGLVRAKRMGKKIQYSLIFESDGGIKLNGAHLIID